MSSYLAISASLTAETPRLGRAEFFRGSFRGLGFDGGWRERDGSVGRRSMDGRIGGATSHVRRDLRWRPLIANGRLNAPSKSLRGSNALLRRVGGGR